jgi:hypothetical protein
MRALLALLLAASVIAEGCAASAPPTEGQPTEAAPSTAGPVETAHGVLRVRDADPARSGKQFIGAELERDDGERWVLDYGREPLWQEFDARRVQIEGRRYQPEGQALLATHFRVETLRVAGTGDGALLGFGPEKQLEGSFVAHTVEPGSKAEGMRVMEFIEASGVRWMLEHTPSAPPEGHVVAIRARRVEPNWSWTARMGGQYLWVLQAPGK